ncbi:MAG: FoF1 ATP synthase subunit a [Patescibacteria group bacterium]|mgnify:CR=1 FL=1
MNQTETNLTQEIQHETTLFAEPLFNFHGFTITNSLLCSWLAVFLVVAFSLMARRKIAMIPKGLQNYCEVFLEGAYNLADNVTGSRGKTMKFLPIVLPLFIFILFNNWLGLLPGFGSIGFIAAREGERFFIPLLRGGTADLNTTLALSIMAVVLTHIFGVVMSGAWGHLNRFAGFKFFLELPRKVFKEKNYQALLVNPIQFFVGLIEAVGEVAKVASLSFRLFGNVFAGEVLLASMAAIFAYAVPLPFIFLEIIVGIIQALIFAMLTLVFLSVMSSHHAEEH